MNAPYGWHVPGGTAEGVELADIEHSWDLSHQDLVDVSVDRVHPQTRPDTRHGTAVLGVIAARDNGRGLIGIAPRVRVTVIPFTNIGTAAAIDEAATLVHTGGVILIETAVRFVTPKPQRGADIPDEFDLPDQDVIRRNTQLGITVVEPAGNAGVRLDGSPRLAHIISGQSGAIMVGEGEPAPGQPDVLRRIHSTYGSRADCFALGAGVRAPSVTGRTAYLEFTGTSAAGAIIAGLAAQVQGIALAATGRYLSSGDVRTLFRDRRYGTASTPPDDGIGVMPDLKRICDARGWPAITPPSVVALSADSFDLAYLDSDFGWCGGGGATSTAGK